MLPHWNAAREHELLKLQLNHLEKIHKRIDGEEWEGSDEFDVDEEFRPFTAPRYHTVRETTSPIVEPPTDKASGHVFLDKTLRDMTGT